MSDDIQDPERLAAAYALGALDIDERKSFEAALAAHSELRSDVAAFRHVVAQLGVAAEMHQPPPRLRAEILRRARSMASAHSAAMAAPATVAYDLLEWESSGIPGLLLHWIRRDAGTGDSIVLMRGEPGTRYPDHRHTSDEHGFILQGAFRDAIGEHHPGDYIHYPAGSTHRDIEVTSPGVCVFLVITGPIVPFDSATQSA